MEFLDQETEEACTLAFHLRMRAGLTQAAFARITGLSVSTIQRYESGRTKPSRQRLELLASSSGVSLAEVEEFVLPRLRSLLALTQEEDEGEEQAASSRFGSGSWSPTPSSLADLGFAGLGENRTWLGDVEAADRQAEDRPPDAPAFSWASYLRLRKAVLHHAMGNDVMAAEELSITLVILADGVSSGPLFIFYLLKVAYLLAAGEMKIALDLLPGLETASRRLPPPGETLRTQWISARIRRGLGAQERGLATLAALQLDFAEFGMALETICVWADRVAFDLEEGRHFDPVTRREELAWARQDRSLSPKMVDALETFLSLLDRGEATPQVARRLVAYLLGTRLHDGAPFIPFPKAAERIGSRSANTQGAG